MVLAMWNCFSIPFFVAFKPPVANSLGMNSVNYIIDSLFVIDIVFTFRTTFFSNKTGEEVIDPVDIAKAYLISISFYTDVLAIIPFDIVASLVGSNSNIFTLFGLLKLIRILRLGKIIAAMRIKEDIKMMFKFGQLLMLLLMYMHLVACGW